MSGPDPSTMDGARGGRHGEGMNDDKAASLGDMLTTIAEQCCCFELSCNVERVYYEEVKPEGAYELCVYWRSPVSHDSYEGDSLLDVVEQAMCDLPGRAWTVETAFTGPAKDEV
jgi:hypothetical protein